MSPALERQRCPWSPAGVLALLLFALPRAATAQEPPHLADVVLRAWVPALRADTCCAHPAEQRLHEAADLALRGAYSDAQGLLDRMDREETEPWVLFEVALFRRLAMELRHHYSGGSAAISAEAGLWTAEVMLARGLRFEEPRRRANVLPGTRQQEAFEATTLVEELPGCLAAPALIRSFLLDLRDLAPGMDALEQQTVESMAGACRGALQLLTSQASPSFERGVFSLLFEVRVAAARSDLPSVRQLLEVALGRLPAGGHACARAELLFMLAESIAAPTGPVELLGFSPPAERGVRVKLLSGAAVPARSPLAGALTSEAEALYQRAAEAAARCPRALTYRKEVGQAFLAWLRRDDATATAGMLRAASAALAEGRPRESELARAVAALLQDKEQELEPLLVSAAKRGDLGGVLTLSGMVLSYSARVAARGSGELGRASRWLRALTVVLDRAGLDGEANEVRQHLLELYSATGRIEGAIALQEESVLAQRRLLARAVELERQFQLASSVSREETLAGPYRTGLMMLLNGLLLNLATLAAEEGDEGWLQRRDAAMRMFKEEAPVLPAAVDELRTRVLARLEFLGNLQALLRKRSSCKGRLEVLRAQREAAKRLDPDLPLMLDVLGARCDPEHKARAEQGARSSDIVNVARRALRVHQNRPDSATQAALELALTRSVGLLTTAADLKLADLLEARLSALEELLEEDAGLAFLRPALIFHKARLFLLRDKPGEATALLRGLLGGSQPPSLDSFKLRLSALSLLIASEQQAGNARTALWAREVARIDEEEMHAQRTGFSPYSPSSAERVALERRVSWSGALPKDIERLRTLRQVAFESPRPPMQLPTQQEIDSVIDALPAGLTVLVYHVGPERVTAWRLERGLAPRMIPLQATAEELAADASRLSAALAQDLEEQAAPLRTALYRKLVLPLGPLAEGRTLAVVAPRALSGIPFEVLTPVERGAPLLTEHAIFYADRLWEPSPPAPRSLACLASSVVAGFNGSDLRHAEQEASVVSAVLGATPVNGPSATRERILGQLPGARYVHLATHGILDRKNPYASFLALADGEALEAWRLFAAVPQAELVALSACSTRTSVSVSRAYSVDMASVAHLGGARWVLASLWPVDDAVTGRLMADFYARLCRGMALPEALRESKQAVAIHGPVRPYHWAPFLLSARSLVATFPRPDPTP